MILHAGMVARRVGGFWRGVLIEGPSGCGKSDLALRLVAGGWRLVADDRVLLWASAERLYGRAPGALRDLIEARGVGVLPTTALPFAEVSLAFRHADAPERLPHAERSFIAGVNTPSLALNLLEAATPARLALAFAAALASDARPHGLESAAGGRI